MHNDKGIPDSNIHHREHPGYAHGMMNPILSASVLNFPTFICQQNRN